MHCALLLSLLRVKYEPILLSHTAMGMGSLQVVTFWELKRAHQTPICRGPLSSLNTTNRECTVEHDTVHASLCTTSARYSCYANMRNVQHSRCCLTR